MQERLQITFIINIKPEYKEKEPIIRWLLKE